MVALVLTSARAMPTARLVTGHTERRPADTGDELKVYNVRVQLICATMVHGLSKLRHTRTRPAPDSL